MSQVSWIKLSVDLFDNPKIRHIRRQKRGTEMALFWVYLLTLAGKCNASGVLCVSEEVVYTEQTLAEDSKLPLTLVRNALELFTKLGMAEQIDGVWRLVSWEEHQSLDKLEKLREQTRKRVENYRNKKGNVTSSVTDSVTVTPENRKEEKKEEKREEENRKDNITECKESRADERSADAVEGVKALVDMYNAHCRELGQIDQLTTKECKAAEEFLHNYSPAEIETLFRKAGASSFLKGGGSNGWRATFYWLIQPDNAIKVLRGDYDPPAETTDEKELNRFVKEAFDSLRD